MRWLLRLLCQLIAHPMIALVVIFGACLAAYDGKVTAAAAAVAVIAYIVIFSLARRWLDVDAVTLDPYRRRRKQRKKQAQRGRAGASPTTLVATRVEVTAKGHRKAPRQEYPELVSCLAAPLNRMVVQGLLSLERAPAARSQQERPGPSSDVRDNEQHAAEQDGSTQPSSTQGRPSAPKVPRRSKLVLPDAT